MHHEVHESLHSHGTGVMSLLEILQRCLELTRASNDSDWSYAGVEQIAAILEREIRALERGEKTNGGELRLLFAPTGALQETSLANGWAEEYLVLAAAFDRCTGWRSLLAFRKRPTR